jgi:pimeloyl-ACP methyl ester carboxylesterase
MSISNHESLVPPPMHIGGTGSPLVLLHGLGGTWEIWKPVLPALEARHRVIALTLPGHFGGPAISDSDDPTVASIADQLTTFLQGQGLKHAHIAGNSLGGWLSLELARRGFALSVTAFSPAGGWRTDKDYRAIARPFRIFFAIARIVLTVTAPFARFSWARRLLTRQMMEHGERLPAPELLQMLRAMANTSALPGLLRTMNRGRRDALRPRGDEPITIAWGEHDRVIPYCKYGASFPERIERLTETVLGGAGHVPMWDNPDGVVAQILSVTSAADARES